MSCFKMKTKYRKISHVTAQKVKRANLNIFNKVSIEDYENNKSLFDPQRQKYVRMLLEGLSKHTTSKFFLDVGCGTGNILRNALPFFKKCIGVDLSYTLMAKVKKRNPSLTLTSGTGEELPFKNSLFDCVSLNALLHHIVDIHLVFSEVYRVLKSEGYLYTDHDPNISLIVFTTYSIG